MIGTKEQGQGEKNVRYTTLTSIEIDDTTEVEMVVDTQMRE